MLFRLDVVICNHVVSADLKRKDLKVSVTT